MLQNGPQSGRFDYLGSNSLKWFKGFPFGTIDRVRISCQDVQSPLKFGQSVPPGHVKLEIESLRKLGPFFTNVASLRKLGSRNQTCGGGVAVVLGPWPGAWTCRRPLNGRAEGP